MPTIRKGYERRQSTGDILLPVPADVAPLELTTTATQIHEKGQYLYYNNQLYRVTDDITSGGTISPGTNCTPTTVGEELAKVTSSISDPDTLFLSSDAVKIKDVVLSKSMDNYRFLIITSRLGSAYTPVFALSGYVCIGSITPSEAPTYPIRITRSTDKTFTHNNWGTTYPQANWTGIFSVYGIK